MKNSDTHKFFKTILLLSPLLIIILVINNPLIASTWKASLTVVSDGTTIPLAFGGDPNATDGFDAGLDAAAAPPGMTYYAYFETSLFPNYIRTDVRAWTEPFNTNIDWTLEIVNATGKISAINWDPANLPVEGKFTLAGTNLSVDMKTQSSATVSEDQELTIQYRPTPGEKWSVPITISNSSTNFTLNFGGDPKATVGFDSAIDVPAAPVGMTYYAYFEIPEFPNFLSTDIKTWLAPYQTDISWTLKIVNAKGSATIVSWNLMNLPLEGKFTIEGLTSTINMRAQSSITFTGDKTLTITYHYIDAAITITSPNGGEFWRTDVPQMIKWTSDNITGNMKIEISTDKAVSWSTIVSSTLNTGSYPWTPTTAFISNNCLIKITSINDDKISDQSDAVFIISDKEKVDLWINKDLSGIKGKSVTIPINASDVTDLQVYSARIMISCDANVIEFTDVDISGTMLESAGWNQPTKNISPGQIVLAMAGTSPLSGSGVLIKIVGNIIGNKGDSTALKFDQTKLNEGTPVVFTSNGLLKVLTGFDIMGQLGYYSAPTTAINDATIHLSGAATQNYVTDKNGNYEFLALPSNDYIVTPEKSNDQKGAISPLDASLILQYEVGLIKLTPFQKIAGDVSDSGEVTSFDASWILRYSIGSVTSFPVGADWTFVPHDFPIDDNNWQTSPRSCSYMLLKSDQKDQNFLGILYGDVSGNWASAGSPSNVAINVQIGNVQQISEGIWQFSINMQFLDQVYSGSFKIIFNKNVLQYQSTSLTNPISNIIFEASNSEEGADFVFASGVSLGNNSLKVKLQLKGLTSTTPSASDIGIENVILDDNPGIISSIENKTNSLIPAEWHLSQNHPNPFNSETSISYQVPEAAHVKIEIFNLLGQHLRTLVNEDKNPGTFKLTWDGRDERGRFIGSGIFICRMQAKEFAAVKKIVLVQ